ncbi:ABC transporter permease subunit [Bacillus thermotolerans]|uniref:ABC transporter, permease protein n=1 Tax=Bacillus thermotolerans TaxID=1221996 RepID=A0A0F5HL26_BACTR|nr:ABC transporter permease subunit [Bacillus thermotolerans]KKB34074.1 ABC transporter, permease protein [Bacillus thermotolerans]KKB41487.1 ABC transporter, permease protein [Bacillus thermotolerans]KKB41529.1 putative ABC transporter, permease protein [Bacillus thermotolerans]
MIMEREWKRSRKSLLIWCLILSGLIIWLLSIFPQFADQQESMEQLFEAYPESMREMFQMNELSLGTLMGFYGIEVYMMITLLGSIYAAILASNMLAKEEGDKTAEFLLSKPVTRGQVVMQKLALILLNIFTLNAAAAFASFIGFQFAGDHKVPVKTFALLIAAAFLLHLTFAALAFLLSSFMKRTRNTLAISIGIVIVTYFFQLMSGLSDSIEPLKYASPFYYTDAAPIINENTLGPIHVIVLLSVSLVSIIGAFMIYKKKDISV